FIAAWMDKGLIDGIIHALANIGKFIAVIVAKVGDKFVIDNTVNTVAEETWNLGLALRTVQTGRLRQYVMFIVVCTVVIFLVASVWRYAVAG
ncbi:MAG: NADH-quinone oxidoreductase subunit L, partial [Pirellulales bacterium]